MSHSDPIRVFIGSGEASRVERKVLIYSLHKHTRGNIDIYVFNGTHNAVEHNDEEPFLAPMSLRVKYRNVTEFSLYRYLIPQLCDYQGKAIYLDSDTICLTDLGELSRTPIDDFDFLAKSEAYTATGNALWGLSVMLINCDRCRFDLEAILQEVDQGLYSYTDFSCMSETFLAHRPYRIGKLDPRWNVFDFHDSETKLIHYTNLHTQPWKYSNHPYGDLWFQYLNEAIAAGFVTEEDIELSQSRSYVRRNLLEGNHPKSRWQAASIRPLLRPFRQVLQK